MFLSVDFQNWWNQPLNKRKLCSPLTLCPFVFIFSSVVEVFRFFIILPPGLLTAHNKRGQLNNRSIPFRNCLTLMIRRTRWTTLYRGQVLAVCQRRVCLKTWTVKNRNYSVCMAGCHYIYSYCHQWWNTPLKILLYYYNK